MLSPRLALPVPHPDTPLIDGPFVLLAPGASWNRKRWHYLRFLSLAAQIRPYPVAWLIGPYERRGSLHALQDIVTTATRYGDALVAEPSLAHDAVIMAHATAVVGNDTGTSHLAAALGLPTIVIFGPTDPTRWAPLGQHVTILAAPHPRMNPGQVSIDRVLRALKPWLDCPGWPIDDGDPTANEPHM
jgi:ADP-heptose:LPS heptosyltransferase